ncbi:MAG: hypothetical protein KDA91_20945 [Planctomycetaceae bacterium]|nr:hypothetical protein [Planctomycetaceae bacterium]
MSEYTGIKFSYESMLNEIRRMQKLADVFLASECDGVLEACFSNLENIRNSTSDRTHLWELSEGWPIQTVDSRGEYRASGRDGGAPVYGLLCFRWEIKNPERGRRRQKDFHLFGEATTSLKIVSRESNKLIAQWQIEAGDASSPGCHFHSAVNQYGDDGLFPEWLKVPRLPSVLLTPMDGLEFLLGELFQLRWPQAVSEESEDRNSWAKSQRDRLSNLLSWKLGIVRESETTPWMALKKAKPELDVLME